MKEKARKFITEEIERLKYAPKLNGCEMQPEWAEQLEIFEYFLELIKKDESNRG